VKQVNDIAHIPYTRVVEPLDLTPQDRRQSDLLDQSLQAVTDERRVSSSSSINLAKPRADCSGS